MIISYLSIFTECLNTIARLIKVYSRQGQIDADDLALSKLNAMNPVHYLQKQILLDKYKISNCTATDCSLDNTLILIIAGVVTALIGIHHLMAFYFYYSNLNKNSTHGSDAKNSPLSELINLVLVNVIDLILKIFSIFIYYIFFNKIFLSFYFNTDIVFGIVSVLFLIFFTFFSYFHVNYVLLFLRFDSHDSLHYDSFSKNYDLLMLAIKIIIAINKNLILINNGQENIIRITMALDYLLIISLFGYLNKVIMNIINDKNLNLVTNLNFNYLRIFNILFLCNYIVINIFFHWLSVYEIVLTVVCSIFISIGVLIYLSKHIDILIYKDEKMFYQLLYLVELFLEGESSGQNFQKTAIKIKTFHSVNCQNNLKCSLCQLEDIRISQEINDPDKINLLSTLFKYIEQNTLNKLSLEESDFFNFVQLIFEYNLTTIDTSIPRFKTIYKTKEMIQSNKEKKNNYYHNLYFFYTQINQQSESELKKFGIVKSYDSSLFSLRKSIDIIKDVVDTLDSRVKKDLYPQTNQLNNLRIQIMKNLEKIHEDKNSMNDTFSFVMTKYIFEKTFNLEANTASKFLEGSEEFDSRHDLISDHFKKDKILIMKYDNTSHSLIITRASKELSAFQGKYLEEIFPRKFRELGKQKLLNEILNNQESFTFEFLLELPNLNPLGYVENIKLECKIFRSADLQEIFILSNFEISKEDIIAFETPIEFDQATNTLNHNVNKSFLVNFSTQLEKILLIEPTVVSTLMTSKLPKKTILLYDVFRKNTLGQGQNKNSNNRNTPNEKDGDSSVVDFILNYRVYYNNFFMEIEKNIISIENDNILKHIDQAKLLRDANYSLNCRLNLKYVFKKSENVDIFVFSFKNFSPKNKSILAKGFQLEDEVKDRKQNLDDSTDNVANQVENINKNYSSGASVSSVSSGGALRDGILSTMTFNGKKSTLNESDKKMANFTITTLFINFCLGLYCLFFLFMGFSSNNKMKELNLLKNNFNTFERMFYQTALSQFYNVGVYKKGTNNMDDYLFGGYWDQFAGRGLTVNMGDYANSELYVKVDFLKKDMGTLQNFIYDSTYKEELSSIFDFNTEYQVLYTSENNELKLQTRTPNFFETILMFMNNAKASVFYTTNTMIYIHNYDLHTGKYDFSNVWDKNITNVQKAVYEAIFNFPVYLNNLNKIWLQVQSMYYSQVDYIFNLNLYLSLILIGLHVFLLIVSFAIISFLKRTTAESNYIYAKVVTGDWVRYLSTKLYVLREMINFYKLDPIKNSQKVRKDLKDTAKVIKDNQQKEDKMYSAVSNKTENTSEDAQIVIDHLISPLMKVLFYLFSFYVIYAYSFILIFDSSKSDIIITSQFAADYLQVDKGIMNSILLLQCIIFSNQTDYSLNQYMKNHASFDKDPNYENGYIWDLIEQAKVSRTHLTWIESNYPKFQAIEDKASEISFCDNLYTKIVDDVFAITKQNYPANSLTDSLAIVCKHYPVMGEKYYTNIIEDINYIAVKMTRNYLHSYPDYTKMKKTNDETEFFDEFTIAVMIIRPIQTYLLKNDIANLTKATEDNFVMIVIVFMIGNILVECLIFLVINRKLIRRVLIINEEIRCLTLCLTA
jgi:hypothetical protein